MSLDSFFNASSIAIIGASANLSSISGKPLKYLLSHNYKGYIYPVNPKYEEIAGLKCYSDIRDIPGDVDLTIIAVNYKMVLKMLENCVEKGVRYAIIFSSGFAEAGEEGKKLQDKMAQLSNQSGIRILGPNCQGMISITYNTSACFSTSLEQYPLIQGGIGFVTQSGALGYSIFNLAQEAGIGFSHVASTGNEVDLHSLEFMEYMMDDPNTRVVLAYLESIKNGRQLLQIADKGVEKGKPIIILKSGKTQKGQQAASSHTASLTGSDEVFSAATKQKGIIRVEDTQELLDVALLSEYLPTPKGNKLGIITTSGGAGILQVDTAVEMGLDVVNLSEETTAQIAPYIPEYGSIQNPVDITAQILNDAEGFYNVLQAMVDDPGIDAVTVVITMITGDSGKQVAEDLIKICPYSKKPVVVTWTVADWLNENAFSLLKENNIPIFKSPARSIQALGHLMRYSALREEKQNYTSLIASKDYITIDSIEKAKEIFQNNKKNLTEFQGKKVLAQFGIPVTKENIANTQEQAVKIANEIGYPVVFKIDSPNITHKTDAGGIKLPINNDSEAQSAFQEIWENCRSYDSNAYLNGVLVQEMIEEGIEAMIGIKNDPQFGPTIVFGLGGIFVEILKDVSLRAAPLNYSEALEMINEIKGYKVIAGARSSTKGDIDALARILERISHIALTLENEINEMDINPILILPEGKGVKVVDSLIIQKEKSKVHSI